MRIGYLDCFSGISGDMLLGALVDAGVPFAMLEEAAAALNVGASLKATKVMRGGLTGTKLDVLIQDQPEKHSYSHEPHSHEHDHHSHSHSHSRTHEDSHTHASQRSLSTILSIIGKARLPEMVKQRSTRAFQLLGEAEAAIHSMPVEEVHFHEVGAVDTIIDIVCTAAGCEFLGVDRWIASPLNVGSGTVQCAHGTLPVPAPATLTLIGDAPIYSSGQPMERVTPTGAAILRMLDVSYASLPAMMVQSSGYGAGGRDTPGEPNLLRLLVGEQSDSAIEAHQSEPISVLVAVVDDATPQVVSYACELLLEAGAWDVYRSTVQMKKGRTGVEVTVLSNPDRLPALREILFRETTTIGLRWSIEQKIALDREIVEVETQWGKVGIKVARWPSGRVANALPEYEHCRALAGEHSLPLKQIMQAAMLAYAKKKGDER